MKSLAGEHLYLPPSLRYFVPLAADVGTPGAHACFEYDLVEAKRPELIVDLGSGNAQSLAVFCQSMKDHDVDGLAYGVDVWETDEQREAEGATTLTTINNFVHTHFRGQAYLLKATPEQALTHFADLSVDLVRFDLNRVERPFAELIDRWTPKLKPGAVMLFAGVSGRTRVLAALGGRSALIFPSGSGLAVILRDSPEAKHSLPVLLRSLSDENEDCRQGLIALYEHAALHHALRNEILGHADVLYRKRSDR